MAAGGFRTFVAGEVLDQDDINDYLMQGVLVFGGTASRGSAIAAPVEGQFAFLTDSDTLTYYDGSAWQEYQAGLFPATVGATTGSPGTGTFTDGNGFEWDYYEFTGNGSIEITQAGYMDILVVGGGGGGATDTISGRVTQAGGGAGGVRYGVRYFSAGTATVLVGAGGAGSTGGGISSSGSSSSLGSIDAGGGGKSLAFSESISQISQDGDGAGGSPGGLAVSSTTSYTQEGGGAGGATNNYDGLSLNYKGSSVTYGVGGIGTAPVANTGSGGAYTGGTGATGVVIVKVLA